MPLSTSEVAEVANEELGHMMQWLQVHDHESQRSCSELQSPKYGCCCKEALQQSSTVHQQCGVAEMTRVPKNRILVRFCSRPHPHETRLWQIKLF